MKKLLTCLIVSLHLFLFLPAKDLNMHKQGFLFSVEGTDGCGKTSAIKILQNLLSNYYPVITTREPGATELGKQIRKILMDRTAKTCSQAEALLFAADRAQHFSEIILPYLEQGYIIISDRMIDSSLVYQSYLQGLDQLTLQYINNFAMRQKRPNLVFYLKIDAQTAIDRINKRNQVETTDAFHKENLTKNNRIIDGYNTILEHRADVIIIDATASAEIVAQQMFETIVNYINNFITE